LTINIFSIASVLRLKSDGVWRAVQTLNLNLLIEILLRSIQPRSDRLLLIACSLLNCVK